MKENHKCSCPGEKQSGSVMGHLLVKEMFIHIGEDPEREGLKDTPRRVVKMWEEIFRGYDPQKKPHITTFQNGHDGLRYDQIITDTGDYYSMCEHHVLPFFGKYYFGYIPHPEGKILGLSKVARIVDYYSAKLQIQERLVDEIVADLWNALDPDPCNIPPPLGMALIMKGTHLCKVMRGARKEGQMSTSKMVGVFSTDINARAEFLNLIG